MNIEDVEKLAELARIELSDEEKGSLVRDFDSILDYIKSIEQAELGNVMAAYELRNVWREDRIEPRKFSRDLIVEQFPDADNGYLKVKKIL